MTVQFGATYLVKGLPQKYLEADRLKQLDIPQDRVGVVTVDRYKNNLVISDNHPPHQDAAHVKTLQTVLNHLLADNPDLLQKFKTGLSGLFAMRSMTTMPNIIVPVSSKAPNSNSN